MYIPIENRLGLQPIALSSTTKNHDLGTLIRARDPVYGEGEFIYLLGTVGTAIGSVVIWEGQSSAVPTYQTTLAPATQNLNQPLSVAMSANGSGSYGWYQIGGQAVCKTNGTLLSANVPVYLAGAGQITSTASSGLEVMDAISITASGTPSSGLAIVEINRPFAQQGAGNITAQRVIQSAADLPIRQTDVILNVKITAPLTITLPTSGSRSGVPLTFVDIGGTWGTANTVTFNTTGGETISGIGSGGVVGNTNFQSITFLPENDLVFTGWYMI